MKKQRTFTMEEVLEMMDKVAELAKGGKEYPPVGSERFEEWQMYGAGISYAKGAMEAQMHYLLGHKFDYKTHEWIVK